MVVLYPNPSSGVLNIKSFHNVEIMFLLWQYIPKGKISFILNSILTQMKKSINIETFEQVAPTL